MISKYQHFIKYILVFGVFLFTFNSCKKEVKKEMTKSDIIEQKIDSLLALMTLEEKIGQMTQVRHFSDIKDGDIASKFIQMVQLLEKQQKDGKKNLHNFNKRLYQLD